MQSNYIASAIQQFQYYKGLGNRLYIPPLK